MSMMVQSGRFASEDSGSGYRYWRVKCTTASRAFFNLAELQMREVPGGADIAKGRTYNASSSYDAGWLPGNAFDGNGLTSWSTVNGGGTNGWLSVDFGSPVDIQEVEFFATSSGRLPPNFNVENSEDGLTWNVAWSGTLTDDSTKIYTSNSSGTTSATPQVLYRVYAANDPPASLTAWQEITFYDEDGYRLPVFDASASSNYPGYPPSYAFDGLSNYWVSAVDGAGQWVAARIAYMLVPPLGSVKLKSSPAGGEGARCPTAINFDRSDDNGATWTTQFSVSGLSAWTNNEERTFNAP